MIYLGSLGVTLALIVLFFNQGNKSSNIYLGLFLLCFNVFSLTHYAYLFLNSEYLIATLLSLPFNSLIYVVGPFAFLYARSILNDEAKLLIAEDIINHSRINVSNSIFNIFLPTMLNFKLKGIHLLLYILFIWYLIFKPKSLKFSFNEGLKKIKSVNKWLFFFTIIISLLGISMFLIVLHFLNTKNRFIFQNETNIMFSIVFIEFIIFIFGLILNPKILYSIPQARELLVVEPVEVSDSEKSTVEIFSLDVDYIEKIRLLINNWKEELKFLDVDSSISSLSKDINLPTYHVTYFFTYVNNEKYIDWRNRLRVEHAIHLMNRKTEYNKTIETMGKESGFRYYATFIQSFKQVIGKLPKDYIKDLNS